jgi:hypothetical protein
VDALDDATSLKAIEGAGKILALENHGRSLSWSVLTRGKQTPVFMLRKSKSRLWSTTRPALPISPF